MLWPGFELRVALRFLREGRMQTVLIVVGVAAGVAVIAYISALISGLQDSTLTKTLGAVEVLQGLAEGEQVLLHGGSTHAGLRAGQRVRTHTVIWSPAAGTVTGAALEDAGGAMTNAMGR